jgi:hypothetical protein
MQTDVPLVCPRIWIRRQLLLESGKCSFRLLFLR